MHNSDLSAPITHLPHQWLHLLLALTPAIPTTNIIAPIACTGRRVNVC